jgi:hypothetical protein
VTRWQRARPHSWLTATPALAEISKKQGANGLFGGAFAWGRGAALGLCGFRRRRCNGS